MPKVSVIIPIYNAEQFLRQCLDSVLTQSLREIEVICVDDGSTDCSVDIVKEYSANRKSDAPSIVLLEQKNAGAGAARNAGIKKATAEFVAFMDADDYYPDTEVLQDLYQAAISNDVKICGGSFCEHRADSFLYSFENLGIKQQFLEDKLLSYEDYQYDYGFYRFIYQRQMLIDNGISFPDYRRYQDPPFMVRAMICAKQFYALKRVSYVYRLDASGVTWNEEKRSGLIDGLSDVLNQANDGLLPELKDLTLERVFKEQKSILLESFEKGEVENLIKINAISANIDLSNEKQGEWIKEFYCSVYQERSRLLQEKEQLEAQLAEKNETLQDVYESKSYRMGVFLLKPFILIKRVLKR